MIVIKQDKCEGRKIGLVCILPGVETNYCYMECVSENAGTYYLVVDFDKDEAIIVSPILGYSTKQPYSELTLEYAMRGETKIRVLTKEYLDYGWAKE